MKGYVYQLYQSLIAWIELEPTGLLALEVAEDFATLSGNALNAVQVKAVSATTTINTGGVVQAIESLIELRSKNSLLDVSVRYLSTAEIGLEKRDEDRVEGAPTLEAWKRLAKSGGLTELRQVLLRSKLNERTKALIASFDDDQLREQLLRKIHFDCGAPSLPQLRRYARARLLQFVKSEGGTQAQMETLETALLHALLMVSATPGEREIDRNDLQKIVDSTLRVSIRQADFDLQSARLASMAAPEATEGLSTSSASPVRPIPPLPESFITRDNLVASTRGSFEKYGIAWLHGASGMGKTFLARTIARHVGGGWSSATLRGMDAQRSASLIEAIADALPKLQLGGLIIDDLEEGPSQATVDAIHYLAYSADRLGIPVIVTSPYPASSRTRYGLGAAEDLSTRVPGFDEAEIGSFIQLSGGNGTIWQRYVYLASGGGHPQLTQGLIRNLQSRGWPREELDNLTSLIKGNEGVEEVRSECRRRLLKELPPGSLSLLQRLSLHLGRFPRRLAIDISAVAAPIANAGFLLDDLIGPWIDQPDPDYLQLSPLLADLAKQSLSDLEQNAVHAAIADSHTKGRALNVSEMNAAVFSALQSQNESAATKFCIAVLQSSKDQLESLTDHLDLVSRVHTEKPAWPGNPVLNLMFRGVQLLLALNNPSDSNFRRLLSRLELETPLVEADQARVTTELMIYVKLLMMRPAETTTPDFLKLVEKVFVILSDSRSLIPAEIRWNDLLSSTPGASVVSFAFMLQLNGLRRMDDLLEVFEFVSGASADLRKELLDALDTAEFDADMFVRSAWLGEDTAGTIDPSKHSELLEKLEKISSTWPRIEVAIITRKYRAIILDEYGNQAEEALKVLDDGLRIYGSANPELMRAKAKVLYRAGAYPESLSISQALIDGNSLSSSVERTFLGRQAAICAEEASDYHSARKLYLFARDSAMAVGSGNMIPMASGLLVDASLAAWRTGDRTTCLDELAEAFGEIGKLDPSSSLRSAHVRAMSQHILLWLDQETTGKIRKLEDGNPPRVYPGCVSNPEPHVEIGKRDFAPIGLSLYLLASIECACDATSSVNSRLDQLLPDGRFLEGEGLLLGALLGRALRHVQAVPFHDAWDRTIDKYAYNAAHGMNQPFDIKRMTRGVFPKAHADQLRQFETIGQLNTLVFCGFATLSGSLQAKELLVKIAAESPLPPYDEKFFRCLSRGESGDSFYESFASLLYHLGQGIDAGHTIHPAVTCLMGYNMAQVMEHSGLADHIQGRVLQWYRHTWRRILDDQRFHLVAPVLHAPAVEHLLQLDDSGSSFVKFIDLVLATLPMASLTGSDVARKGLSEMKGKILASEGRE